MVSELGKVVVQAGLFVVPVSPMLLPRLGERRARRQQKRHDLVPLDNGAASTALDRLAILSHIGSGLRTPEGWASW
jgi:hypothetical protein